MDAGPHAQRASVCGSYSRSEYLTHLKITQVNPLHVNRYSIMFYENSYIFQQENLGEKSGLALHPRLSFLPAAHQLDGCVVLVAVSATLAGEGQCSWPWWVVWTCGWLWESPTHSRERGQAADGISQLLASCSPWRIGNPGLGTEVGHAWDMASVCSRFAQAQSSSHPLLSSHQWPQGSPHFIGGPGWPIIIRLLPQPPTPTRKGSAALWGPTWDVLPVGPKGRVTWPSLVQGLEGGQPGRHFLWWRSAFQGQG